MLRIHFTGDDLARTRVAKVPDPLWELVLSMDVLRSRGSDALLAAWRRETADLLRPGSAYRAEIDILLRLNPPVGYFPDFLTPAVGIQNPDEAIDQLIHTPVEVMRREIGLLEGAPLPELEDLRHGRPKAVAALGAALRRYREVALDPVWERIRAAIDADRAMRARTMAEQGIEAVLNSLHSAARWSGGVLEIDGYRDDTDLYLHGRGLTLVPSYFKTDAMPMKLADPELPQVLVYAVDKAAALNTPEQRGSLAALIGKTRAAVLEVVDDGCTTTELARRLGISPSGCSEHLTVLREAGLLVSRREGNRVIHALTPLGRSLLG